MARHGAPVAAIFAAALVAHGPCLANGFVWDDDAIIVSNPTTGDLTALPRVLLSPDEFPPYYRPLTRASFLVDHALFGMDPRGFHAVNLLVHAAAAVALYALGLRVFAGRAPAAAAALLLAVHPVNAEAVNFVTGRNNALATLFAIAALVLLVDAERLRSRGRALASAAALFAGLLAKEPALMALPVMAAWLLFPRPFGRERRGHLALLAPHLAACAVYAVLRHAALGGFVGASSASASPAAGGLAARLLLNAYTIPRELALVAWPRGLAIFHPIPTAWPVAALAAGWVAIAAVLGYFALRPAPASTLGLLWFGLNLLPIANLVAIPTTSLIAERYLYAPAVGLWLVAAEAGRRLARLAPRPWAAGAAAACAALAVGASWARARDWRDDFTLAESAVQAEPASAEAHFNLGVVLKDAGDLARARVEWEEALRLDPRHARALVQRGTAAAVTGDLPSAERDLLAALALDPDIPLARFNLARLYELAGRRELALAQYRAFVTSSRDRREAGFVARAEERLRALQPR